MSIKALDHIQQPQTIKIIRTAENKIIHPMSNQSERVKTLPDIMDEAINEFLDASSANIAAKVKFHKILDAALPRIMQPENYINKGRESKVFRISDNYVAKVRRGKFENNAIHFYDMTKAPDKRFNQLGIYYGEPVIKLGNVEILKNATPNEYTPCGIIWKETPKITDKNPIEKYKKEYLPLCSSLPQESYDEFAFGLKEMNGITDRNLKMKKISYTPDIQNPNNFLIAENQFRIVDKLDKTHVSEPNTVYTMLQPLILRLSPDMYVKPEADILADRRNITRKALIAAEKANLPLSTNETIDPYAAYYLGTVTINGTDVIEFAEKMRAQKFPIQERIDFINKALTPKK